MQVLLLIQEYGKNPEELEHIWVYDEEFVKGLIHMQDQEVLELYVDWFFRGKGIGGTLREYAVSRWNVKRLVVLEKNREAIAFYQNHGFSLTENLRLEPGTTEYVVTMERREKAVPGHPCGNSRDMLE